MSYYLIILFTAVSFFVQNTFADLAPELIQGDQLYEKRENIDNAHQALYFYNKYLDKNPKDKEGLWRASMANYYVGHLIEGHRKRKGHYKAGIKQGNACLENSKEPIVECYFWLATNTALLKKEQGILTLVIGIGHIITLYGKALKIDPHYASSGPYRMLALLYYKAPGFLGGDVKKAYSYIEKSILQSPSEPMNTFFLIKFLNDDSKTVEAMSIANKYIKNLKDTKFPYLESRNAYKKILHFIKTKELMN